MEKSFIYPFAVVALATLLFTSGCHQNNNTTPTALVGLHLHTSIDTVQLDPGTPNTFLYDSLGRLEELTLAQVYITNLSFRNKSTQQWSTITNSIFLKRLSNEIYPVGNIPAGTYDAISFTVGLGNTLNSAAPSSYLTTGNSPDTVLSATEQSVMWGSGMAGMAGMPSGYTFLNVQGYDSTDHIPFSYQIGGYGDTVQVTLPYPAGFTIAANEPNILQLIHVIADYGTLLQSIRPINSSNNNSSFYGVTPNAANSLRNNIVRMFRYECPVPNGNC